MTNASSHARKNRLHVPHLHRNRLGVWCFRLTIAGRTVQRSLGTKDRTLATMRASALNWQWSMTKRTNEPTIESILQAAKEGRVKKFDVKLPNGGEITGINTDGDLRRAKDFMSHIESIGMIEPEHRPLRPAHASETTQKSPRRPFHKAVRPYLAEKAKDDQNDPKTLRDKEATYALFASQFDDPDISTIGKAMAVEFKRQLLAGAAGADRVNKKIGHLSDFFTWAIGNGEAEGNPFLGIRISKKSKLMESVESYEPFTANELAAIFNPQTYAAYAIQPHFHWLPFLLLHTGARPNELASLRLDQLRSEQGIDYFAIKKAKNSKSIRKVPWSRAVRESAFPAYVAEQRAANPDGQLFPLLLPTKNGHVKNVSRRFNENYLPTLRIDDPTHRLYSFRSNFITRMSELNVNAAMIMALVGHYEQTAVDLSSPHFKNYQGAKLIGALRDTIDLFDVKLPMVF